ncbi:hypothetical protein [Nocardia sp. NPDC057272]|uniref:hypothetical protein n=1 Tax=Nocardia sp. NPDC057272 TaxID=3346079 RepID=UPI00362749E3
MPDLSALPGDLLAAVHHATAVVTVGADPDAPGLGVAASWRTEDAPGGAVPPAVVVAKLRAVADAIERGAA